MVRYGQVYYRGILLPGFQVGTDGSIWSQRLRCSKVKLGEDWKELKPVKKSTGHKMFTIFIGGKQKCVYIHRLVLETFIGLCPKGMECRHLDGNPGNNNISNLAWGTRRENMLDRSRHGIGNIGERCHCSKLKTLQVLEIRRRYEPWSTGDNSSKSLVKEFGISYGTFRAVIYRKTWKHI